MTWNDIVSSKRISIVRPVFGLGREEKKKKEGVTHHFTKCFGPVLARFSFGPVKKKIFLR